MATDAARPVFPNYIQMRQPVPMRLWYLARGGALGLSLALVVTLFVRPSLGLTIWWGFFIPLLPLWFFIAPGLWRNVCPMATLNQTPRLGRFTLAITPPAWMREYAYVFGFVLFMVLAATRKVVFNGNGPALAVLLLVALGSAFAGGYLFKGKSGWCSSICPLLPVQRVYGQTPFVVLPNAHCQPCVGCARNCYDFNPHVAYLADLYDDESHHAAYRRLFVGAFPGFVLAFYRVPNPPAISNVEMYARFLLYIAVSAGSFFILSTFAKMTPSRLTALYGAAALNIYYWYNTTNLARQVQKSFGAEVPDAAIWIARAAVLGLTLVWLVRTVRKEPLFLAETAGVAPPAQVGAAGAVALRKESASGRPEVTLSPEGRRLTVEPGRTLLEVVEANGLKIEAGCRMGMCGADPIAVLEGMEHLTPVRADERGTLERLGLAENTRLACCAKVQGPVSIALTPERPSAPTTSRLSGFRFDATVKRIVVIGNGAAGITAADHVRRRHPSCEITVVGREPHHFYNRMAIERLIYGRSAMQGLYLMPESWYDERRITCMLNTRVSAIDREKQEVALGTGERLPYDRLILAMGSSAAVPPIDGLPMPGAFVLREAADAIEIRAFAQEHGCWRAVVAGGGLLGLEAAHALHRLGLRVTVLERSDGLLRRQLDPRGSIYLQEYLEGLGLQVLLEAETVAVRGNGRVQSVRLKDDHELPCDLFLLAAGITPNVTLARQAGLAVNRGVVVDDFMRTSDSHIFAAGDVAEHDGQVYGLWPAACDQAQVAANNAVGGDKRFTLTTPVTMLKVVGVDLLSVGRFTRRSPEERAIVQIEESEAGHRYRRLLISEGRIVGGILLGYPLDAQNVTAAVRQEVDVSGCFEELRAGNWDVLATLV
jgi:NADPH-dependent 2,4-dienoyl-CoA reductase/sulfur reductase-like enzyme/ferredoxin